MIRFTTLFRWMLSIVLCAVGSIFYWYSYDCEWCWTAFIVSIALAAALIIIPAIIGFIKDVIIDNRRASSSYNEPDYLEMWSDEDMQEISNAKKDFFEENETTDDNSEPNNDNPKHDDI